MRGTQLHLPSNFLCLDTNVVRTKWLVSSTRFSNSSLLCWLNLSSISVVQHVYSWGQMRKCSPAKEKKGNVSMKCQELWVDLGDFIQIQGPPVPSPPQPSTWSQSGPQHPCVYHSQGLMRLKLNLIFALWTHHITECRCVETLNSPAFFFFFFPSCIYLKCPK